MNKDLSFDLVLPSAFHYCLAFLFTFLLFKPSLNFAQNGKDGALSISSDTTLNTYSKVVADASIGDTQIFVMNVSELTGIAPGDLIMIIQMQGASINSTNTRSWGEITSLNNAGNYEMAYVLGVDSLNHYIQICSPLTKNYNTAANVQVVRIPQFTNLSIQAGAQVIAKKWNGITGGIVAIQASNTITVDGEIDAEAAGFRGGLRDNSTTTNGATITATYVSSNPGLGAEKGESIAGFYLEYDQFNGRYARGAPANGGGGGNSHNAGGGGGANAGVLANWNGNGVMSTSIVGFTAYQLDPAYIHYGGYTNSSGGGRGGYSYAGSNQNALTLGPSNSSWGGDRRDSVGGLGGRPIEGYSLNERVFLGGGG
ncbi:MAG: hypothetical protein AAFN10_12735, partial [Bacteroidota bacterium]